MNIWDHSKLSVKKFGGQEEDFYSIHKFIDSSKLYYFNPRHRLLLHNLFGIDLTIKKFGDYIQTKDGKTLMVRDIAAEHCKEDLSNQVPSLADWLKDNDENIAKKITLPKFKNKELEYFILQPLLKSNLRSSLLITWSNFGVNLVHDFLGKEQAIELQKLLPPEATIQNYLSDFQFTSKWQFTPSRKDLEWLAENK